MKSITLLLVLCLGFCSFTLAQNTCMTEENIKSLDAKWEEANLHPNPEFLDELLGSEFVWVHNHGSMVDTKDAVVKRAKAQKENGNSNTRSRKQSDVKVAISGNVAVVTGITVVDRGPSPTTYHFMRTYVNLDGKCVLVGNHTMAIPDEE